MLLYLFYNSDMIEVPKEMGLGYMDDMVLVAMSTTFDKAHLKLLDMMTCQKGGNEWSSSHY